MTRARVIAWVMAAIGLCLLSPAALAVTCPSGAEVQDIAYCRFFRVFRPASGSSDSRLVETLGMSGPVRSIALIVGISRYPNLVGADRDLPAARIDLENLVRLLSTSQRFDEVIAIPDGEATAQTISYFLEDYVPQQGTEADGRARFLFAFSGHGVGANGTSDARILLGGARNATDVINSLPMRDIGRRLSTISRNYFHVLALLNTCFGGNIFDFAPSGGSQTATRERGAYALVAGSDTRPVVSLGEGQGSLFFDAIVRGVQTGDADGSYGIITQNGRVVQRGGVVRLAALNLWVADAVNRVNNDPAMSRRVGFRLDEPWVGSLQPSDAGPARGAFFFLSQPLRLDANQAVVQVPSGPRSSLPGQPEVRYFGAVDDYPVRGIDISQHEGDVDWERVRRDAGLSFIYLRAHSWAGDDRRFANNATDAARVGLDRGAFIIFDFCASPEQQADRFMSLVEGKNLELPPSVHLAQTVSRGRVANNRQHSCFQRSGIARARQNLLNLLQILAERTQRVPVLYGVRSQLEEFSDPRLERYMLWIAAYRPITAETASDLALSGSNPWTLWQHSGEATVRGIGDHIASSVFFGTAEDYSSFREARNNVALNAARSGR